QMQGSAPYDYAFAPVSLNGETGPRAAARSGSGRLHHHCGAIGEDLGDAVGDLVRVVAHADHRIGAELARVLDHQLIGLLARLLGEVGVDGDVAAEDRLEARADVAEHAARAHRDAAHEAEIAHDPLADDVVGGGDDHGNLRCGPGGTTRIDATVRRPWSQV